MMQIHSFGHHFCFRSPYDDPYRYGSRVIQKAICLRAVLLIEQIVMQYTYKAAWSVVGGINLPATAGLVELSKTGSCRFVLTNDVNELLADIDIGTAIGRLMLKTLVGQHKAQDFVGAIASEVEKIRAERRKKAASSPVLVAIASGMTAAEIKPPFQEHDGFVVAFDVVDKASLARAHRAEIDAMKLAVAFESQSPSRFLPIGEGVVLRDKQGRSIYSVSFSASADATVSSPLSPESAARISARYEQFQNADDLESVGRLFSQMAQFGTDRLRAFLSGWAALEIFVAKTFKKYEETFFAPLSAVGQHSSRERFLERIKGVMNDKYRLTDKFSAITAVLFADREEAEVEADMESFRDLKRVRDSILHGDEFSEKDLPVHALAALLRKYVLAHIAMPNNAYMEVASDDSSG